MIGEIAVEASHFPMKRGVTFLTSEDLKKIEKGKLPRPDSLTHINILFEMFIESIHGSKDLHMMLVHSHLNPYAPRPVKHSIADAQVLDMYIPGCYHAIIWNVWLYQIEHFTDGLIKLQKQNLTKTS